MTNTHLKTLGGRGMTKDLIALTTALAVALPAVAQDAQN